MQRTRFGAWAVVVCALVLLGGPVRAADRTAVRPADTMSSMGRAARQAAQRLHLRASIPPGEGEEGEGEEREEPNGGQAEVSIAVDATGQHVVVGFNDTRGFSLNPIRVSGYAYSDDGGRTFTDGGQLPSPGDHVFGTTHFPQVFGDPDVKYVGACTFIYSSIVVDTYGTDALVQAMGFHRSTDCGHTWEGPFVIPASVNPNGLFDPDGFPADFADKEFMDVDRDTGRVLMTWTNFTPAVPGFVQITATYSDDITAPVPSWSPPLVLGQDVDDGQFSIPRFEKGSDRAYAAWTRFPGDITNSIVFVHSTDNGATWTDPAVISPEFRTMDYVLGNDRVHDAPGLAVDNSPGPHHGTIYVVYADNDSNDGADVALQVSRDGGFTFSPPRFVNARPGRDRAQWFPWVTVDTDTGRAHVFYYDQGVASSGDRTIVSHTYSDDGGRTWSTPRPLMPQFHAGWGNDTGQPNLGDYNQAVAQGGELYAAFGYAFRPPGGFVDGQPTTQLTVPGVVFRRVPRSGPGFAASIDGKPYPPTFVLAFDDLPSLAFGGLAFPPRLGVPVVTTLLAEDFEGAAPGALPGGWTSAHGAGDNVVPWTTDAAFCGGSNAAFHADAIDGPPGGDPARWERLLSPAFHVPAGTAWVLVEFDTCYDTEDDPRFNVLAYDGFFLRLTDLTPGHTVRSVLAEAFEDAFVTGDIEHYPKHLPRNSDPNYFEDMSAWAGDSGGVRRVRMLLPGMAGTTVQLRFEYTQDGAATCADVRPGHTCGVSIDNLVVRSIGFTTP